MDNFAVQVVSVATITSLINDTNKTMARIRSNVKTRFISLPFPAELVEYGLASHRNRHLMRALDEATKKLTKTYIKDTFDDTVKK